ncbi:MAG TPA: HAD family hydrolase [Polyangiaceae bacterium]|nr:HAD family hydrolase [Polyangiaceae bacterium]
MKALKAVLLDVDGTLVDSNDAHAQAWLEVFERNGYSTSFERVRELIGEGGDKLLPQVAGLEVDSHEGKRLSVERAALFRRVYLPNVRAFPKAEALLRRLSGAGLRLIVASSAKRDELTSLLQLCGALALVQHETSADDAQRSKPDPDIVQVALHKAECAPAEAVLLGDTPHDMLAASRAGVGAIALRSGGHPDSALRRALAIYDDAADLLANFETSIFAQRR